MRMFRYVRLRVCLRLLLSLKSQLVRGFLAGLDYQDGKMLNAEYLDNAVNDIFEVCFLL